MESFHEVSERFLDTERDRRLSPETIRTIKTHVRTFNRWLYTAGILKRSNTNGKSNDESEPSIDGFSSPVSHASEFKLRSDTKRLVPHHLDVPDQDMGIPMVIHLINKDDARAYVENMVSNGMRNETIKVVIRNIGSILKWMVSIGMTPPENANAFTDIPFRGKESDEQIALTPTQIRSIRSLRGVNWHCAVMFEMMISCGFRMNELCQLRFCDIDFTKTVVDVETRERSDCFTGAVLLSKHKIQLKSSRSRSMYVSNAAARILILYAKELGIPINSAGPIYPYDRGAYYRTDFPEQVRLIIQSSSMQEKDAVRDKYFRDITSPDPEKDMTPLQRKYAQAIMTKKARGSVASYESFAAAPSASFHPHTLRHTCAAMMYYRMPCGSRYDVGKVASYLGHSPSSNVTNDYLNGVGICKSDAEWRYVFRGSKFDWPMIKM